MKIVLFIVLFSFTSSAIAQEPAKKSDQDRMQGKWKLVAGEQGGKPMTEKDLEGKVIVIKDKQWIARRPAHDEVATMVLDPAKSPKEITVKGTDHGRGNVPPHEVTLLGIYEWEGERLRVCVTGPNANERPKDFKSREGKWGMLVLERVKEAE